MKKRVLKGAKTRFWGMKIAFWSSKSPRNAKKMRINSVSGDSQEILVDLEMWQKMLKWPFSVVLSINRWKGHVCKFCWNDLTMGIWEGHWSLDSKMIWVYWKKKKAKRSPDRKFDNEREFYLKPERCPDWITVSAYNTNICYIFLVNDPKEMNGWCIYSMMKEGFASVTRWEREGWHKGKCCQK